MANLDNLDRQIEHSSLLFVLNIIFLIIDYLVYDNMYYVLCYYNIQLFIILKN